MGRSPSRGDTNHDSNDESVESSIKSMDRRLQSFDHSPHQMCDRLILDLRFTLYDARQGIQLIFGLICLLRLAPAYCTADNPNLPLVRPIVFQQQ